MRSSFITVAKLTELFSDLSSDESQSLFDSDTSMSVITPRATAKFNHSIALIFAGFFDQNPDQPRDPIRWSSGHVSLYRFSRWEI